ncbi:MAG: hypothetical protein PHX51_03505 [Clostridia bacterium]|nr:hypothetical protein [Clostridia bacterium]
MTQFGKKHIIAIVLAIMLIAVNLFVLSACIEPKTDTAGTMTLVVNGATPMVYEVDLSKVEITNGLISILEYLKDQGLTFTLTEGIYGSYLTQVNELEQNYATSQYIYLYTSVSTDFDVSEYATTFTYEGTTLTSCGVGASSMSILKDCVIVIGLITY